MTAEPFATDRYRVADHEIVIYSYRDGVVDAHRQRNGSGVYNARHYTLWRVHVAGWPVIERTSRHGYTKWEAFEAARQRVAPTEDARPIDPRRPREGKTRSYSTVRTEMKETRIS